MTACGLVLSRERRGHEPSDRHAERAMNGFIKTLNSVCLLLVVAVPCNSGCMKAPKMFSLDNTWPFRDKDAPQEGTPIRMVGTWTDTVLTEPAKKPQRGFGGRVMFY